MAKSEYIEGRVQEKFLMNIPGFYCGLANWGCSRRVKSELYCFRFIEDTFINYYELFAKVFYKSHKKWN